MSFKAVEEMICDGLSIHRRHIQENFYIYRYHGENPISCNVSWPTLVFRNVAEVTEENNKTLYSGLSAAE